ncbi:MAG: PLP-dependent cysteine synthase family protein [Candidatus Hodgkinia cicadicola]
MNKKEKPFTSVIQATGGTPIVRLARLEAKYNIKTQLYAKLEFMNPLGSVKDRIANALIDDLIKRKALVPGGIIVEASSGNTGIALAAAGAVRGFKCMIVVPEGVSDERTDMLDLLGASIVFAAEGIKDAYERAVEMVNKLPNAVLVNQFENKANVRAHKAYTAKEIVKSMKTIDYFVAGVGTGGTITGVGETLKRRDEQTKIVAVEPWNSAILSGEQAKSHSILGLGVGFLPKILNTKIIDYVVKVKDFEAIEHAREAALTEGLACGISSGAALFATLEVGRRVNDPTKKVLTILPSGAERYLSTELFDESY